jgi:hypothetical protein
MAGMRVLEVPPLLFLLFYLSSLLWLMSIEPKPLSLAKDITTSIRVNRMVRLNENIGKYAGGGSVRAPNDIWRGSIHGTPFSCLTVGSDLVLTGILL